MRGASDEGKQRSLFCAQFAERSSHQASFWPRLAIVPLWLHRTAGSLGIFGRESAPTVSSRTIQFSTKLLGKPMLELRRTRTGGGGRIALTIAES
jgi:hypothetical protein